MRAAFAAAGPVDVIIHLVHAIGQPGVFAIAITPPPRTSPKPRRMPASAASCTSAGVAPDDDIVRYHLAGRAEVADALTMDGGPDVVSLGAAVMIGVGRHRSRWSATSATGCC